MSLDHVIVTGGTGVTGVALVRHLLDIGKHVTAIIRPGSARRRYLPEHDNLKIVECALADYPEVSLELFQDEYSVFYHLAWDGSTGKEKVDNRNNMPLQSMNIVYEVGAVELCHRLNCPVFVATGTQAEYGRCETVINEETLAKPENGYGSAKVCAGNMTRIMCQKYGIKHIWARLFSIYGPFDGTESLVYTSMLKLLSGIRPQYTAGIQEWDYLYSFDAARALVALAKDGKDGEIYCVANGNTKQLKEYIETIHKVVNPDITPVFGEIPYASNQVMHLQVDTSKVKQDTGFEPLTTFEEGIQSILDWTKQEAKYLGTDNEFIR